MDTTKTSLFGEEENDKVKRAPEKDDTKKLKEQLRLAIAENDDLRLKLKVQKNTEAELILLKPDKTFGLNVSGDVFLNKMEVEIVDSPFFQRLAYVNQLGSTTTVYRSANHSRFEHSIGVLKMADLMVQKIRSNKHSESEEREISFEEEQIIRLLALLHDIGHMPFGHTIEDEFNIFQSHDMHSSRWKFFLGQESYIGKIIIRHRGESFFNRFFSLIKCDKDFKNIEQDAFMYDIVSNTVCADLLDYLHRDCKYTNLKLNFHPRFLDYLIIKKIKNAKDVEERRIVIRLCKTRNKRPRKDIPSELVQLLRNRYYLGERVYYHHTKIKTGTMIAGAVLRAKEAGFFEFADGHSMEKQYAGGDGPLYDIHTWGDVETLTHLKNLEVKGDDKSARLLKGAKKLAQGYIDRTVYYQLEEYSREKLSLNPNLIKEIIEKKITKDKSEVYEMWLILQFADAQSRLNYEENICSLLPDMESGDFLIYFPNYKMQMKLADVKVEEEDHTARSLRACLDRIIREECEEIIAKHQDIWRMRIFLHPRFIAPPTAEEEVIYEQKYGRKFPEEYRIYRPIIEKYCKAILGRGENEDRRKFFQEYWKDMLEFIISTELDKEDSVEQNRMYNPIKHGERKNRPALVAELADELAVHTSAGRGKEDLMRMLKDKFTSNIKKS